MSWIEVIDYQASEGKLRTLYDRIKRPDGYIDSILLVHGLRPHTLQGHMVLYKNVLHHRDNQLDKWFLESIGILVSLLNRCEYCVAHHFEGLKKLLDNETRVSAIKTALESGRYEESFSDAETLALQYVQTLTREPAQVDEKTVEQLKHAGYTDGEILEINQVTSYLAYANRTVLGLGVSLKNDILGLSPGDSSDPDNWQHT